MPNCRPEPKPSKLGVHLLLDDGRGAWAQPLWADHLRAAQATIGAGGYVTQLIRLDDLEPEKWQYFLDLCASPEIRPLIHLATVYDQTAGMWVAPPADVNGRYQTVAQQYATFIAQLTWAESPIIIVGNEPNHGYEWGGVPDPAAYRRFLLDVGQAIKAQQPDAMVLNAGLDLYAPHTNGEPFANGFVYMDAETFLDEMVAAVTLFAFNGRPAEWGHTNWLILDQNGRILGTYFPDFYATFAE